MVERFAYTMKIYWLKILYKKRAKLPNKITLYVYILHILDYKIKHICAVI